MLNKRQVIFFLGYYRSAYKLKLFEPAENRVCLQFMTHNGRICKQHTVVHRPDDRVAIDYCKLTTVLRRLKSVE